MDVKLYLIHQQKLNKMKIFYKKDVIHKLMKIQLKLKKKINGLINYLVMDLKKRLKRSHNLHNKHNNQSIILKKMIIICQLI